MSRLHRAILSNNTNIVRHVMTHEALYQLVLNDNNELPIVVAIVSGRWEVFNIMTRHKNFAQSLLPVALHAAAHVNSSFMFKTLVEQATHSRLCKGLALIKSSGCNARAVLSHRKDILRKLCKCDGKHEKEITFVKSIKSFN